MEKSHIDHLIQRYLENTITEKDRLELMRVTRAGKIEELLKGKITETLSEEMRENLMPDARERHRSEKIFKSIVEKERSVNSNRFAKIFQYAAAVIVLAIAGLSLYFQDVKDATQSKPLAATSNEPIAVKNNESKSKKILLQDGSTVLLEPGSEVRYDQDSGINGKYFFQVRLFSR